MNVPIPSETEFKKGLKLYRDNDPTKDVSYWVATKLMKNAWGNPEEMTNALAILLLTWNQAFYGRFGYFSIEKLERCLETELPIISGFRERSIESLAQHDGQAIRRLFNELLLATRIVSEGKKQKARTPVGVAKSLHLLAPAFFPVWDTSIAIKFGCYFANNPEEKYLSFCSQIQEFEAVVKGYSNLPQDRTLIKLIDEYTFAKYTKRWL